MGENETKKVLVVDDEALVRRVIVRSLERMGYESIDVADGHAALDVAQNQGDQLRCVLLDLTMPELDGYETFRRLKAISAGLPIVIMSGYAREEIAERMAPDVPDGYLSKPFMIADVEAAMRGFFSD